MASSQESTNREKGHSSRRNRIFGSIANYTKRSRPIKLPASNLLKGRIDKRNCGRFASSQSLSLSLSLLNSPLERYPFPRWLSTVCNKREIGEAEWRREGEGRVAFGKQSYPTRLSPPPSRFSSQGRDVCT